MLKIDSDDAPATLVLVPIDVAGPDYDNSPPLRATAVATQPSAATSAPPEGSAKPVTAASSRYYTYRKDVPLGPGQVLDFTKGKGYYARTVANDAAPSAPQPTPVSPVAVPAEQSASGPTKGVVRYYTYRDDVPLGHRQTLAFTAGRGYFARDVDAGVSATSSPRYYTYRKDVPIGPGQVLDFTRGKGYYARDLRGSGDGPAAPPTTPPPGSTGAADPPGRGATASRSTNSLNAVSRVLDARHRKPRYDPKAAIAYAQRYSGYAPGRDPMSTQGYNKKYPVATSPNIRHNIHVVEDVIRNKQTRDDCTNFVSQVLHAGGWAEDNRWNFKKPGALITSSGYPVVTGGMTPAWQRVNDLVDYIQDSGRGKVVPVSRVQLGDVIVADWSGRSTGPDDFNADHAMIVVGFTKDGVPKVASHGSNHFGNPLTGKPDGDKRSIETISELQHPGKQPTFMAIHINR